MIPPWSHTELISGDRRTRLIAWKSFDSVLQQLVSSTKILSYEEEPFKDHRLHGCVRASFLLLVDSHTYDGFFNSSVGYRAQYCQSFEKGEQANRQLIEALRSELVKFAQLSLMTALCQNRIEASLDATDAKIWIDESEPVSIPPEELTIHINYQPWVDRAIRADKHQEEEFINAVRGVFAPFGTRLEVKGAWLGADGCERRDPSKAHRSKQIALDGYS